MKKIDTSWKLPESKLCCLLDRDVECTACGMIWCNTCWGIGPIVDKHSPAGELRKITCPLTGTIVTYTSENETAVLK